MTTIYNLPAICWEVGFLPSWKQAHPTQHAGKTWGIRPCFWNRHWFLLFRVAREPLPRIVRRLSSKWTSQGATESRRCLCDSCVCHYHKASISCCIIRSPCQSSPLQYWALASLLSLYLSEVKEGAASGGLFLLFSLMLTLPVTSRPRLERKSENTKSSSCKRWDWRPWMVELPALVCHQEARLLWAFLHNRLKTHLVISTNKWSWEYQAVSTKAVSLEISSYLGPGRRNRRGTGERR